MGSSGGHRKLPGGSDHFSLHTDKHCIIIYISPSSSSLAFASKLLKCFHFQSFVFLQQKIKFSLCDSLHCFSQPKDLQTNKSKTSNHNYKLAVPLCIKVFLILPKHHCLLFWNQRDLEGGKFL